MTATQTAPPPVVPNDLALQEKVCWSAYGDAVHRGLGAQTRRRRFRDAVAVTDRIVSITSPLTEKKS